MGAEKVCRGCGVLRPLCQFSRNRRMKDGLQQKCKECCSAEHKQWRNKDPERRERSKERARRWRRENPERAKENVQRWLDEHPEQAAEISRRRARRARERNPEKHVARKAVSHAMAAGKLERGPCEICGCDEVEAHHEDYAKPLEIRWLCRDHHRELEGRVACG